MKRQNKLNPKALRCWYLGPVPNHPHGAMRTPYRLGRTVATRNVTWAHIPAHVSPTSHQAVLAPNGAKDFQGGGNNGEVEEEPASTSEAESQS